MADAYISKSHIHGFIFSAHTMPLVHPLYAMALYVKWLRGHPFLTAHSSMGTLVHTCSICMVLCELNTCRRYRHTNRRIPGHDRNDPMIPMISGGSVSILVGNEDPKRTLRSKLDTQNEHSDPQLYLSKKKPWNEAVLTKPFAYIDEGCLNLKWVNYVCVFRCSFFVRTPTFRSSIALLSMSVVTNAGAISSKSYDTVVRVILASSRYGLR